MLYINTFIKFGHILLYEKKIGTYKRFCLFKQRDENRFYEFFQ